VTAKSEFYIMSLKIGITGMSNSLFFVLLTVSLWLFSISVNAEEKKGRVITMKKSEEFKHVYFPKIENYDIELECVSPIRSFNAGEKAIMTFRLKNFSLKPLVIYEWYAKEANNLRFFYVPWSKGMKKPSKGDWVPIIPDVAEKQQRRSLELKYKNSVLIEADLSYIKELKPEREDRYYII
jgi:hypothetical protein